MSTVVMEDYEIPDPKPGTRVVVMDASGVSEVGYGTFMGRVSLREALEDYFGTDDASKLAHVKMSAKEKKMLKELFDQSKTDTDVAKIILDSGEATYAFAVTWHIAPEASAAIN
jgi:hypothetical protein